MGEDVLVPGERVAVIDVGSNSGRAVVFRLAGEGHLEILADARVPLRLARHLRDDGCLGEIAIGRTLQALRDFDAVARGAAVSQIVAVGTSAVREARDGPDLVERARREVGMELEVVDGDREAQLSFLGAVHGLPVEDGMLIDVGGGSLEVSTFRERGLERTWTLPLGALRLSDRYLAADPPAPEEVAELRDRVLAALRDAGIPAVDNGMTLAGTGGTVRNLAAIDERRHRYFIPNLHGYVLRRPRVREVLSLLAGTRAEKRSQIPGLSSDRADSIVGGVVVVDAVMEHTGADELLVSGQGLREGVALDALGLGPAPLPAAREASITALAARFSTWNAKVAARRVDAATALADGIAPDAGPEDRELLGHAAAAIDLGRAIDYYERHAQAAAVVMAADLDGFTHRHRAAIAAILREAGGERIGKSYRPLLDKRDRAWIPRAAVLLAVADEIERRTPPDEPVTVRCEVRPKAVVVRSPSLGSWRPRAVGDRFRRAFHRPLIVEAGT